MPTRLMRNKGNHWRCCSRRKVNGYRKNLPSSEYVLYFAALFCASIRTYIHTHISLSHSQILHNELEASLQSVEEQLAFTSSELDKQKVLNEKLENDLVAMNKHNKPNGNGAGVGADGTGALTPSGTDSQTNLLAGLELGKKSTVVGVSFDEHLF